MITTTFHGFKPGDIILMDTRSKPWWCPRFIWRVYRKKTEHWYRRRIVSVSENTFVAEEV